MSVFSKMVGVADDITKAADLAKEVADIVVNPDKDRADAAYKARQLVKSLEDARGTGGTRTVLTAGWRPVIGWVCVAALGYQFIGRDLIVTLLLNLVDNPVMPPELDAVELMALLGSLLGIGGYRTIEKIKGVAK